MSVGDGEGEDAVERGPQRDGLGGRVERRVERAGPDAVADGPGDEPEHAEPGRRLVVGHRRDPAVAEHEEHVVVLGVGERVGHVGPGGGPEPVGRPGGGVDGGGHAGLDLAQPLGDDLTVERPLVVEVVVRRADRDAQVPGDPPERDGPGPLGGEQAEGGVEDVVAERAVGHGSGRR